MKLAQSRLDERLAGDDPCSANDIDESDLAKASDEQRARVDEQKKACTATQDALRLEEEERQAEQQRVRLAEEKKKARVGQCDKLAVSVQQGAPDWAGLDEAKPHAQLLARIASGKLVPADVGKLESFPCMDIESVDKIAEKYLQGVLATAAIWMYTEAPTKTSADLIVKGKGGVTARQLTIFERHVESIARIEVRKGDAEGLKRVEILCDLKKRLQLKIGQFCKAAATIRTSQ